jgi:hypothetical protein
MRLQFANNAATLLADPVSDSATACQLAAGGGAEFPTLAAGEAFYATFVDALTGLVNEIVLVTGIAGDNITAMERGQDNTTAVTWLAGDHFEMLVNAATMREIGTGTLIGVQQITAAGTLDLMPGAASAIIEGVAGGGGGGGAAATDAAHVAIGAAGGSGGYFKIYVENIQAYAGAAIAIGAAGAAAGAGGGGGNGGTTGIAGLISATGGAGGAVGDPVVPPYIRGADATGVTTVLAGSGVVVLAKDVFPNLGSYGIAPALGSGVVSAPGGNNPLGSCSTANGDSEQGDAATGYGAGGSGAVNAANQATAQPGGAGAPGELLISYYA